MNYKRLKGWFEKRKREVEKNPEFFENYMQDFLELLFIKKDLEENDIIKKLKISKETFVYLKEFLKKKGYLSEILGKRKGHDSFEITNEGIDFLLNYKKITAEKKRANWMVITAIFLAITALLGFYITYLSSIPQVVYTDNYFCPPSFNSYAAYSELVNIPLSNIGKMQSRTYLEILGENIEGEPVKNNFIISSSNEANYQFKIKINNSNLEKASYSFRINYDIPLFSNGIGYTKICSYKKMNMLYS